MFFFSHDRCWSFDLYWDLGYGESTKCGVEAALLSLFSLPFIIGCFTWFLRYFNRGITGVFLTHTTMTAPQVIVSQRSTDISDDGSSSGRADSLLHEDGMLTPTTSSMLSPLMEEPSYKSFYPSPPPVKYPYNPAEALDDLPGVSYALEQFLMSHMLESEEYCDKSDERK